MTTPIQVEAVVTAAGTIEIPVPQLAPGQRVHVSIEPEVAADGKRHVVDVLNASPGHQLFTSAEEVDAYLQQERDSWDR